MEGLPLPGSAPAAVVVPAPGRGDGYWAGASSVVHDGAGGYAAGYRVRNGHDGHDQTVLARSADGERFETVAVLERERFGARWMQRPALVRTGDGWRLFVCCGAPESKRWWIETLQSPDLEGFATAASRRTFPDEAAYGVKDPVVRLVDGTWHAWICCHPLDVPGAEDRMFTGWATSPDGWDWTWRGTVLRGRPGAWDARGARLTTFLPDGRAGYDGRATAEENWFERTAVATPTGDGRFAALPDSPVVDARYLDVLALPDGGVRIYYEARLPDLSHELRTELIR
ncbi:hypothetical protein [Virgisporangium aliadipatigenens]|nr:hypothetical protein [Virgisporangium aliadipatigenens]